VPVAIVKKQLGLELRVYKFLQILRHSFRKKNPILEGVFQLQQRVHRRRAQHPVESIRLPMAQHRVPAHNRAPARREAQEINPIFTSFVYTPLRNPLRINLGGLRNEIPHSRNDDDIRIVWCRWSVPVSAQEKPAVSLVAVRMLATVEGEKGKRIQELKREDTVVKPGKQRLQVSQWTSAKRENGGLALSS
jgi:hypothetical protein